MKRRDKNVEEFVLRHLGLFKTPPQQEMDLTESRIESRLRTSTAPLTDVEIPSRRWKTNTFALVFAAAAAVVLAAFLFVPRGMEAEAAVLDGSFSVRGTTIVRVGDSVKPGELVRTNDASSAIQLSDSRVEAREGSEFLWERAEDGVRVRLNKGSVIVNAQPGTGRVYVQTTNAVVVGSSSVFLVVAEDEGSHVGVIQGEVLVQQGAAEKKLAAAEQLATSPSLQMLRLTEAVAWSRNAAAHVAMLLKASPAAALEKPLEERVTFDVISIRPGGPIQFLARGGPIGDAAKPPVLSADSEQNMARTRACDGPVFKLEVDSRRFVLPGATVYRLISLGYGLKDCSVALQAGLVSGGPDWIKSERFDIEAIIPEGSPSYTRQELGRGEAPKLQRMIRALLSDRFNLVLHRETKETTGFNLIVARAGKIKLSEDQTPPVPYDWKQGGIRSNIRPRGVMLNCVGNAVSIPQFADCFQKAAGGPITDKTDLKGLYDIPQLPDPDPSTPMSSAFQLSQTLEQMGLKLEPVKTTVETLVIDRVTKPTEN